MPALKEWCAKHSRRSHDPRHHVSEMTVSPLALQLRADPMTSTKALCRSEYPELVKGPREVDQRYDDDEDPERDEASQRRSQIVVEFFLGHGRHHTSRSLVCQPQYQSLPQAVPDALTSGFRGFLGYIPPYAERFSIVTGE
jgi:hypothetical protein